MKTVIIFGGSGFIGSNIVRRLSKLGYKIIIPTSNTEKASKLKICGEIGQILPINLRSLDLDILNKLIEESHYILNLRTIWQENKKSTFENQIFDFNKKIVNILKNFSDKRYIYFSGIGISGDSKSNRTKAISRSEKYIKNNIKNFLIIRPSIVIGNDDKFINRLLKIFYLFYIIPLFGDGKTRIQPTYVDDVALAIQKLILKENIDSNIYELGGNEILTYKDLYIFIAEQIYRKRLFVPIPFNLAILGAYIFEKLNLDLINREQVGLFKEDNLVTNEFLTYKDIEIDVTDTKEVIKNILNKKY